MYEKHFGLNHKPFSITPDPHFLYLGDRHREALAHLLYGVGEGGGFVQLTGEVGTGKTTLCRSLLEQLPAAVDVALILNPRLDAVELVAAICDELGAPYPEGCTSLKILVSALNAHLLKTHAAGRRTVLIIDEAQNLSPTVLEQVRLLTNLETTEIKLLEIILIGQPELRSLLERDDLRQLAQRITARYHLEPLSREETQAYIRHRLRVAGVTLPLFTASALKDLARLSGGVPRLINVLCDRALLGAYVEGRSEVGRRILRQAAREVLVMPGLSVLWRRLTARAPWLRQGLLPLGFASLLILVVALTVFRPGPKAVPDRPAVKAGAVAASAGVKNESSAKLAARLAGLDESAEAAAWDGLFALWGGSRAAGQNPCAQAKDIGLRCQSGSGNWNVLRRHNRPALLRLRTPAGQSRNVLLVGLGQDEAHLRIGTEELHLPIGLIDRYWYGEYQILWRTPIGVDRLREGDRGPEVLRLRAALNRLSLGSNTGAPKVPAGTDPALFDADLSHGVSAFQAAHDLRPDGIVGIQTIFHLSEALDEPGSPRLAPRTD